MSFASTDSAKLALEYISKVCNEPSHTPIADKLLTPEYLHQSASDFYQIIQTARSKPKVKIGADLHVIRPDGHEMVYRNNSSVYLKKRKARDHHAQLVQNGVHASTAQKRRHRKSKRNSEKSTPE